MLRPLASPNIEPGTAQVCCGGGIVKYRGRLSGPLAEQIDLHVYVPAIALASLASRAPGDAPAAMRQRVESA